MNQQSYQELGTWYFPEGAMLFAFMGILIGAVYGLKEDKIISAFMNGAADLLSVALIVAIARGIQVIMNDGMITDTILNWGKQGLSGLSSQVFIVLTYIFYLPMSFLIPSSVGRICQCQGKLNHHSLPVCFRCAEPGCTNFWYRYGSFGTRTYQYRHLVEIYR